MASRAPLIIAGGGLAGALAALVLAERRPELPILLLESGASFGGNHTWSFFDSDVPAGMAALAGALRPVRWERHRVRFEQRERVLPLAYNAVSAPALDTLVRARLAPSCWRLGTHSGQRRSTSSRFGASGLAARSSRPTRALTPVRSFSTPCRLLTTETSMY